MRALTPNVQVFRDGAYERQLGSDEITRVGPLTDRISALIKRDIREFAFSPSLRVHTVEKSHEGTRRWYLPASQEENPHQHPNQAATLILGLNFQKCKKKNKFLLFKSPSLWYFVMVVRTD